MLRKHFICQQINQHIDTIFSFSSDQHNYEISSSGQGNGIKSSYRTNSYGKSSIIASTIDY